jgi:hypothetical protein
VLESIQTLAGTTSCKGVQIARLKDWAIANHCWLNKDSLGTFIAFPYTISYFPIASILF